jgi:hypothetical protein
MCGVCVTEAKRANCTGCGCSTTTKRITSSAFDKRTRNWKRAHKCTAATDKSNKTFRADKSEHVYLHFINGHRGHIVIAKRNIITRIRYLNRCHTGTHPSCAFPRAFRPIMFGSPMDIKHIGSYIIRKR